MKTYRVLFRLEKLELLDKCLAKIKNLQTYMDEEGHQLKIEVVMNGDIVKIFKKEYSNLFKLDCDIILCHNALSSYQIEDINTHNIRTVKAGIGEIIEKKADGWIEYTIE